MLKFLNSALANFKIQKTKKGYRIQNNLGDSFLVIKSESPRLDWFNRVIYYKDKHTLQKLLFEAFKLPDISIISKNFKIQKSRVVYIYDIETKTVKIQFLPFPFDRFYMVQTDQCYLVTVPRNTEPQKVIELIKENKNENFCNFKILV